MCERRKCGYKGKIFIDGQGVGLIVPIDNFRSAYRADEKKEDEHEPKEVADAK